MLAGQDARATGARIGTIRMPMAPDVRKPRSLFENVPADGHHGRQLEETRTSVRRRFLGSSTGQRLPTSSGRAGDKEQ
jgi:hypothetical protein